MAGTREKYTSAISRYGNYLLQNKRFVRCSNENGHRFGDPSSRFAMADTGVRVTF
jgi:hypothetical protein